MKRIIIVDKDDKPIGLKDIATIDQNDIYRVTALWITNSNDEILLAKRHANKTHDPGKWGPAVAGTVEEGEGYDDNIYKEADEELGINGVEFTKGPKIEIKIKYHYFCQWYLLNTNKNIKEFTIQKDEVVRIKWFTKKEFLDEQEKHPEKFIASMKSYLRELVI